MDLSALFKRKQNEKQSYFGLFLRGESAVGFVFEIVNNTVSLIAKEKIKYRNSWENIVDDVDELLAILENETKIHVNECIYFIYSYFIDDATGEIKDQYKNVMRQISKELDLKPLGFIECHESVKDMLEKEEGTPLNSVMAEIDSTHVSLYVYKGGKLIYKDETARTDSITDDLTEIIDKRKDQYLLPSKMVVYGSSSLEKEAALIKEHNWKEDAFIQAPRLLVLNTEDVLRGLGNTFMEQVQHELGNGIQLHEEEVDLHEDAEAKDTEPMVAKIDKKKTEDFPDETEGVVGLSAASSAEVAGASATGAATTGLSAASAAIPAAASMDEAKKIVNRSAPKKKVVIDDGIPDEAEKVGFVVGEDVTKSEHEYDDTEEFNTKKGFSVDVSFVKNLKFPKIKFGGGSKKKPKIQIFVGITALLLIATATMAEYTFHKAKLEVIVPSSKISNELSLEGEVGGDVAGTFSVVTSTTSADVKDEIGTTGQREVGEKAKGTVILNNFEDRSISYSAGTKMTGDNLTFVLDSDVSIASASSSVTSIQAQTKEAGVTAENIGTEYNIDKDKRLSVSGATSRNFAVAKGAFTGGTKKTLKTVAKKDLDTLQERVLAQAKKLNQSNKAEVPSGMQVLPELTEVTVASADYSGEVGQEAEKVSVNAEVRITYYLISKEALKKEIATQLEPDIPSGFKLDDEHLNFEIDNVSNDDGQVSVDVLGEATAVKEVNTEQMLELMPGKSIDDVKKILRERFDVEDVVVKQNATPIFPLSSLLPFKKNNITIDVRSK